MSDPEYALGLLVLLGLEAVRHAVDLAKFGRTAADHMWSAKAWGVALFLGFAELLVTSRGGPLFGAAVALGVATNVEGLLASLVLRGCRHDVHSLYHAVRIRRTGPSPVVEAVHTA